MIRKFSIISCKYTFKLIKLLFTTKRNETASIIVLSFKNLGDTVFTVPAINHLIKHNSGKNIYIFCFEGTDTIYRSQFNTVIFKVYEYKDFSIPKYLPPLKIIIEIIKLKPYAVINLTSGVSTTLLALFSLAKIRVGFGNKILSGFYDYYFPYRSFPHLMDMYGKTVEMFTTKKNDSYHQEFTVYYNKDNKILINPFAGWNAKVWGIRKFIELGEILNKEYSISFIAKASEFDTEILEYLTSKQIKVIFTNTIMELINEIKNCSLFIGNDSGPLNVASLYGIPTFTIYGPTNPEFSIPKHKLHRYINKIIHCSPSKGEQYCHTFGGHFCPYFKCMTQLSLDEVLIEVRDFIQVLGFKKKSSK